jgi:hypothetical protein
LLIDKQHHVGNVNRTATNNSSPTTTKIPTIAEVNSYQSLKDNPRNILLATAVVEVKDKTGQYVPCRALLDSGSQSHFITEVCTVFKVAKNSNTYLNTGYKQCQHCNTTQCFDTFKI